MDDPAAAARRAGAHDTRLVTRTAKASIVLAALAYLVIAAALFAGPALEQIIYGRLAGSTAAADYSPLGTLLAIVAPLFLAAFGALVAGLVCAFVALLRGRRRGPALVGLTLNALPLLLVVATSFLMPFLHR